MDTLLNNLVNYLNGGIFLSIVIWIVTLLVFFCILYAIIKNAVKNAIFESQNEIIYNICRAITISKEDGNTKRKATPDCRSAQAEMKAKIEKQHEQEEASEWAYGEKVRKEQEKGTQNRYNY